METEMNGWDWFIKFISLHAKIHPECEEAKENEE